MIKFLFWSAITILLMYTFFVIYEHVPGEATNLNSEISDFPTIEINSSAEMFLENLRFNHNDITYFIESECSESRATYMEEALAQLSDSVGKISFSAGDENADIIIGCSNKYPRVDNNFFTAGEGGPTEIMKNGRFNIINKGMIYLYKEEECENPSIELHELLHVFGFMHSPDPNNIMYNVSSCQYEISSEIINTLHDLYSLPALPDLKIENLNVIKRGRYLDFNITILNEGLADATNVDTVIFSKNKKIKVYNFGTLENGYSKTLYGTNIYSPNEIEVIDFYVDYENNIAEIDETNNYASASIL